MRGVGEVLPFRDSSFDAVISTAVLEHVKDPFRCADPAKFENARFVTELSDAQNRELACAVQLTAIKPRL